MKYGDIFIEKGKSSSSYVFIGYLADRIVNDTLWYNLQLLYKDDYTKCPYYNNNVKMNVHTIFGENVYEWFIPIEAHSDSSNEENVDNNYRAMH